MSRKLESDIEKTLEPLIGDMRDQRSGFFFRKVKLQREKRQGERERERESSICWFSYQMVTAI